MSWGTVLSAASGQISGPVYGAIGGDQVTITSYDNLEGAYNAGYAWSATFDQWLPSGFVVPPGTTTFAGDFNTPTSSGAPIPPYGDNLLGIIAPTGASNPGDAKVTLSFAQTLGFVEFQVTAETELNFTAALIAYDSNGAVLGTYVVTDQGTGGVCSTLNQGPPQDCTAAPYVQFYDPEDRIASVELTVSDPNGGFIDELEAGAAPELSSRAMLGIGMIPFLLWSVKRKMFRRRVRRLLCDA